MKKINRCSICGSKMRLITIGFTNPPKQIYKCDKCEKFAVKCGDISE